MKNLIEYFYNITIDNLQKQDQIYFFKYNFYDYYFVPFLRPLEDLPSLNNLANEMYGKGVLCHTFILNKDKVLFTKHNEQNYVLLRINMSENKEIGLNDLYNFHHNLIVKAENKKLMRNDWGLLWGEKIDYFEYQIRQLGQNKKLIVDSFSYYIGLAENAISYANMTNLTLKPSVNDILTICHRRIFSPNYAFNILNPISFIIDYEVRDIAEYMKALFFSEYHDWYEIETYLNNVMLTPYSAQMLFARLLYPSYYFDLYESIMHGSTEEKELIKIIEKVDSYEIFLKDVYDILNKKNPMPKIDWICNK